MRDDYGPATYGDRIADSYDAHYELPPGAAAACVEFLAPLAGAGTALELGIGTGRVALPLAARGVEVHGVDASRKMVAKLRAKKGGRKIPVTIADFADVPGDGACTLVFVVFNTFFALLTQDDQVRCFENVARRLAPGGTFVIEAFVPDPSRFDRGQRVDATFVGADAFHLDVCRYDAKSQTVTTQHVAAHHGKFETFPVRLRFAWPSELDLMARIAGLRLRERWSDWSKAPFTSATGAHVSVYEKPR
jgi:SAM-dependent methyltransferase